MNAIATIGLTKSYGSQVALAGVDLEVAKGCVYGLIGPNGSGKTTLLEILAGLRRPSAGHLRLAAGREALAYCPDVAEFEGWLSATEVLESAAGLLGRPKSSSAIAEVLARVGLTGAAGRRVGGFSRGMTARLNLAAALVDDPEILLLDEPAAALDPAGRVEILELVASLAGEATVVVSSHDLADVERVCDDIGMLAAGRLAYQGPLADLLAAHAGRTWRVVVRTPAATLLAALAGAPWVEAVSEASPGNFEVQVGDPDRAQLELPRALAESGARVVSICPMSPSLEEVFLSLTAAPAGDEARERS